MADDADRAQELAATLNDTALAAHRRRVIGPAHQWCIDCGGGIPIERQRAAPGAMRCFDCQQAAERRW
ncbi:TraR/DksA family transcriptional regulator [Zavarzinia sp.]|uniref:TraR/DksA family transcriptional regulator n=1 Tax=Zavarzinia sp. TaxID=2027920 RepID=UPI003BB5076A